MMAYPRGQIKSYGSCSRHVLGISIFPVGKKLFSQLEKKIFLGIKKACG
jgi:hypothetical protein